MELTRRGFLAASGAALAGSLAFELSRQSVAFAFEADQEWKLVNTEEYTGVCCYCSGGCGSIISVRDNELINLEGDIDNPISAGGLCSKGATMFQLRNVVTEDTREVIHNPNRTTKPLVRRPGAAEWSDISWDELVKEVARHVKDTRDATFEEKDKNGLTVNRTLAIASLGGSQQNNEEDYLILKSMRSLGVIAIDNQARV
ncbi:MAG TPA: molybdopterin oxidoreductase [Coriobacteriia bacterium]|nr:molybdopterin oxidoreductase [Coriobacteriia bacterium]